MELFGEPIDGVDRAEVLRNIVRCIDLTTLEGDDTAVATRSGWAIANRVTNPAPDPCPNIDRRRLSALNTLAMRLISCGAPSSCHFRR